MDHLRALKLFGWLLVGFTLTVMSSMARAYPATQTSPGGVQGMKVRANSWGSSGQVLDFWSTCVATPISQAGRDSQCAEIGPTARANYLANYGIDRHTPPHYWNTTYGSCYSSYGNIGATPNTWCTTAASYSCPGGGTLSGSTCTCAAGQTDTGSACSDAPVLCTWPQVRDPATNTCGCSAAGTTLRSISLGDGQVAADHGASGTRPNSGCFYGCGVTYNWPSVTVAQTGSDGQYYTLIDRTRVLMSGASCTPGADAPTQPTPTPTPDPIPDNSCPQGFVRGTVNGASGCYPGGTKTEGTGTQTGTKTNPDGTTSTTTVNVTENTICSGAGACTTTTVTSTTVVTRDAQGNVTGTTTDNATTTKPGDGTELGAFCAKNPKATICAGAGGNGEGEGSSFGGSCGAFTCDGDAVQCAIALEQHKRNCEFWTPVGDASRKTAAESLYSDAVNGTGLGDDFMPRGDPIQAGTLNTTDRISSGQCPAPVNVATPLGTFVLDFTNLCPWFEFFGYIVLTTCLLIAARITVGGIIGA